MKRSKIFRALTAEGIPALAEGYQNLHLLPMYQKKIAMGPNNFPWSYENSRKEVNYQKGICPIAEKYHEESFLNLEICVHELDEEELNLICLAFEKVWKNLNALRE